MRIYPGGLNEGDPLEVGDPAGIGKPLVNKGGGFWSEKAKRANPVEEFPEWVTREIENPADEGGRNSQCIKIGPTILRCGASLERLEEIFRDMHPGLEGDKFEGDEIDALVKQSANYAKTGQTKAESVEVIRRRMLYKGARSALPQVLAQPRRVPPPLKISPYEQYKLFLQTLFAPSDILWIGEKFWSGKKFEWTRSFRPVSEWLSIRDTKRNFICPNVFKPGSISRTDENVLIRRYLVVESDKLSRGEVMSVFAWLQSHHRLEPRALIDTGGKSLHAWFDWPGGLPADWKAVLNGYQCDGSMTGASQPCRLPGVTRKETGKLQALLLVG